MAEKTQQTGMPGRGRPPVQKAKNFKAAWGKLLRFCRPHYTITIVAFVLAIAATVLQLIGPNILKNMFNVIDEASLPSYMAHELGMPLPPWLGIDMEEIVRLGTILIVIYVTGFVLNYIQHFIMATVTQKIGKRLRTQLSQKINKLPFEYYDRTKTGDILSRITNDVDTVSNTLNQSVVTLIAQLTMLVGAIVWMVVLNWIIAITAIVSSIIGFFIMGIMMGKTQKHFMAQQKSLGEINGHIEEYYSGHTVMKVSNASPQVNKSFDKMNNDMYGSAWKSMFYSGLMMPLMNFVSQLSFVSVCIASGILMFNGSLEIEVFAAFMIYVRLFNQPLGQLAQAAQNLQSTAASSERVFEFLEEPEMEDESALTQNLETIGGDVNFVNVKFGYKKDKTVIKDFSANIKSGSKVAIVGPTGAGKTTLVNLLMKFYKIDGGDIKIDGVSINELKRDNVHQLFGMVLQDTWLFEGTVRENLVYNMQGVTEEKIDAACKAVGIDHFISTLPKGYDTILNESASISSGQKQLLTIARAMIKDAPLLILDEATSSVDTRTEVLIQEAMDKLTKGRTSFVIAHRLSTIKNADMILVLHNGDIIESGNHKALIAKNGFYADLYNSQFSVEHSEVIEEPVPEPIENPAASPALI